MRGKVVNDMSNYEVDGDHPRVCGEKSYKANAFVRDSGSPPRMRGKGRTSIGNRLKIRITPAYAGKRQMAFVSANNF